MVAAVTAVQALYRNVNLHMRVPELVPISSIIVEPIFCIGDCASFHMLIV